MHLEGKSIAAARLCGGFNKMTMKIHQHRPDSCSIIDSDREKKKIPTQHKRWIKSGC